MTELVFRDDAYARSCAARIVAAGGRGIRLDRTVFYPTGGGQPGDSGVLRLASGDTIAIIDTVKGEEPERGGPHPGTRHTAAAGRSRAHRRDRLGAAPSADAHA